MEKKKNLFKQIAGYTAQAAVLVGGGAVVLGATAIKNHAIQHQVGHHIEDALKVIQKWQDK